MHGERSLGHQSLIAGPGVLSGPSELDLKTSTAPTQPDLRPGRFDARPFDCAVDAADLDVEFLVTLPHSGVAGLPGRWSGWSIFDADGFPLERPFALTLGGRQLVERADLLANLLSLADVPRPEF